MGIGKIVRRTFLIGSAAVVGGAAFGAWAVSRPAPNPFKPGKGEAALTPFVFVDQNGVTLIAPRAEMGQGTRTTWAALIAEELDVDLDAVNVIHGPPAKAYYNSALVADALPGKGYDSGGFRHNAGEVLGVLGKVFDMQVTGGSTAMKDGFERMRLAGASAREALKDAAANRLGVDVSDLRTENGQVIAPDGQKLTYAELAEDAAQVDLREPELRNPANWKILGKSQPRVDIVGKSTGTAQFGIDVRMDGMKFASIRMSPRLGGVMKSFDASAAEKMPGVEKIVDMGAGVAVVANNTWLAIQALDAIDVEWGDAPYPPETDGIFSQIRNAMEGDVNSTLRDDGDVESLPEGATEISAEYATPFLAHATMEPMNATALFSGDALEVWCGNQAPIAARDKCAAEVGLEAEAVTINTTYLGGGFGRRFDIDYAVYAARVAKEMQGTPVQVTWSREEDMRHDFYRPGTVARYRGAVKDGKAVMMDGQIAAPNLTAQAMTRLADFAPGGPDRVTVEGAFNQPYGIPNHRIRGYLSDVAVPVGFWRSVGASHNGFHNESFIDEMAHAAGADPLEFRLELMRGEHEPSVKVMEAVRDLSGWTGQTPDGVGRGVAYNYSFGTPTAEVIEVVEEDGLIRIANAWIACDVGIALDPSIIEAQMISGLVYGLSAAVHGEITFADGEVEQGNFPDYDAMRMHNMPKVEVKVLENMHRLSGVGEPGTPPAAPALANALFDLTGKRARTLPLASQFDLLT